VVTDMYPGKQVDVYAIGKKGNDVLRKTNDVVENKSEVFDSLNFDNVSKIADDLMAKFTAGQYDKIILIYNQFKNAATQIVQSEQFLPLMPLEGTVTTTSDYIFEPSKEEIILTLIPKSLKTQLYKAIRDSFASEHGARMTAMHKATDNATELRNQLKLTYNKARQAAITNEILEIVGGAEALNS
jgi:F-type H+-transporting ATPase subunit gamma